MQALARFIMRGPSQAILVAVGFGLLSIFPIFSVLGVVSGAAVALVTLRQGGKAGFIIVATATLIVSLFMMLVQGQPVLGWILSLGMWLPVWLLAMVLRGTISWPKTLNVAIILGFITLTIIYISLGDPARFWQQTLEKFVEFAVSQGAAVEMSQFKAELPVLSRWITGFLVAILTLGTVSSLLLARWWQSVLYHPGGFRQEFHGLRMRRETSMAVMVVLLISIIGPATIDAMASDLLMTVMVVYGIAGLGFVHHLVAVKGMNKGWLIPIYGGMFIILPHIAAMLAAVGFADSWADFRTRLSQSGGSSGP